MFPHSLDFLQRARLFFLLALSFLAFFGNIQAADETLTASDKNRICLAMIVKNESKIIERCLDSVKDIVDCISICDTGSNDNTKEIIERYCQKNQIPGIVYSHEWKNFGFNRTLSIEAAKETLDAYGLPADSTYFLLLDADMRLMTEPFFCKGDLTADTYRIIQKSSHLSYYNTRLIRASLPWECRGVTHEYWACKVPCSESKLPSLWIDDLNDGGSKGDKFERDARLLIQGLADEPNNERYMFYLAQTYKCLKMYGESIRWYKARIQKRGMGGRSLVLKIYDRRNLSRNEFLGPGPSLVPRRI